MAESGRITNPAMGSNELGGEIREVSRSYSFAGTNTQLHLTALGGKNHRHKKQNINGDSEKEKNVNSVGGFLQADETDE